MSQVIEINRALGSIEMSKHLRIIKERTENITPHVDLRGLGNEKVFKHFYPKSVLTEKHTHEHTPEFLNDCKKLGVHIESSSDNKHHHYTCISKSMTHKEQAVTLFLLALKHSQNIDKPTPSRFSLWEAPIFKTLMQFAIDGHPEKEIPSSHEFWSELKKEHKQHVWLDASIALHLKQAGFDISDATEHGLELSHENCQHIYKSEIKKLHAQHEHEKNSNRKVASK